MEKIEMKKKENLKSGFIKTGIHPINRQKLLERLAENKNNSFDEDLVGKAFLEQIQKKREDFIGGAGKPRKKKLQVLPGDSISIEDLQKERDKPGSSNEKPRPKKKKIQAVSSSSCDESDIMDLESGSDSNDVDDCENVGECEYGDDGNDDGDLQASNYNVDDFVFVKFDKNTFPGRIVSISDKGATVDCMEKLSKSWQWPTKKDCMEYEWSDVVGKIKPPILCKRNFFRVPVLEDFV